MDFLKLAKMRYSVRKFKTIEVEKEKLELILEAAKLAPTACNFQPQRVLVIKSKEGLEKLKSCTRHHFNAPLAILICYDKSVSWKRKYDGYESGDIDASIITTHMMLEITNLGLGSTWVGDFDPQKIKSEFNIPNNYVPVALLPIGYESDDSLPNPNHEKRLELNQIVSYNSF